MSYATLTRATRGLSQRERRLEALRRQAHRAVRGGALAGDFGRVLPGALDAGWAGGGAGAEPARGGRRASTTQAALRLERTSGGPVREVGHQRRPPRLRPVLLL